MPKGNFSIDYLASPEEVLDEGEGLEVLVGHDGVEDPLVVSVDNYHGLKYEELSEVFESEICSLGQCCEAGSRSRGRMRWREGSCSVSASSTHAR